MRNSEGRASLMNIVLLLLFVIASLGFIWTFMNYRLAQSEIQMLTTAEGQAEYAAQQTQNVMQDVAQHIILPTDEPALATIENAAAMAEEQPDVFANAQDGDQILIFSNRAIIYSPERDIIVNVVPVYYEGTEGFDTESVEADEIEPITVEIRNGSDTAGAATELGDTLGEYYEYEVSTVGNAAATYEGTVLVNLSGADVTGLENGLGVTSTTELPEGEASSSADAVIIIGN